MALIVVFRRAMKWENFLRKRDVLGSKRGNPSICAAIIIFPEAAAVTGKMMAQDSRDLVRRTINFDSPARIPRQTWILPWAEKKHPGWVRRLRRDVPDDIVPSPVVFKNPPHIIGEKYSSGLFVDEWGCRFENPQEGVMGIVSDPVIKTWNDLENWNPPPETLSLDRDAVNAFCRSSDCFVYAGSWLRPLERFQFLRTMEQSLVDLIEETADLKELLNGFIPII